MRSVARPYQGLQAKGKKTVLNLKRKTSRDCLTNSKNRKNMARTIAVTVLCAFVLVTHVVTGDKECSSKIRPVEKRACPDGLRDDGLSCWNDSYGRGAGRIPDKAPCADGQRDDGTSCWIDSYGRGAGRTPDKAPCPSGLRDDGTSCWNDAHIYGKGCCCTLWGCCNKCPNGYHDDGCTCRKMNVGIKLTLFQRQSCRGDEEKYGSLCYPKCSEGYHPVGCCVCEPSGGPRIVKKLHERQSCLSTEEKYGALCYPKCKEGYRRVGCCVCEPEGGPGIKITLHERQYCAAPYIKFNGVCIDYSECSVNELTREMEKKVTLTPEQKEHFQQMLAEKKAGN